MITLHARQQKRHRCKEQLRTVFWTLWEKARVGWSERTTSKHVYYHMWNGSPVHVQCMRQCAQGWCTGMTQRDGMGREVIVGFKMGNTCKSMADSCKCILFNSWVIFHCVYVPQLSYPFICWWTSRLLPCPGCYKQCCDEHWGVCVPFNHFVCTHTLTFYTHFHFPHSHFHFPHTFNLYTLSLSTDSFTFYTYISH